MWREAKSQTKGVWSFEWILDRDVDDHYLLISRFQKAIGRSNNDRDQQLLYNKLFVEELQETLDTITKYKDTENLPKEYAVEILDGIFDMRVIQLGSVYHGSQKSAMVQFNCFINTVRTLGLDNFFTEDEDLFNIGFREVNDSNMSKFIDTSKPDYEKDLEESISHFESIGVKVIPTRNEELGLISLIAAEDTEHYPKNKLLKPLSMFKPDLNPLADKLLEFWRNRDG